SRSVAESEEKIEGAGGGVAEARVEPEVTLEAPLDAGFVSVEAPRADLQLAELVHVADIDALGDVLAELDARGGQAGVAALDPDDVDGQAGRDLILELADDDTGERAHDFLIERAIAEAALAGIAGDDDADELRLVVDGRIRRQHQPGLLGGAVDFDGDHGVGD